MAGVYNHAFNIFGNGSGTYVASSLLKLKIANLVQKKVFPAIGTSFPQNQYYQFFNLDCETYCEITFVDN